MLVMACAEVRTALFTFLIVSCVLAKPQCTSNDFGIHYDGVPVFQVFSANNTCSCSNYLSSGSGRFGSLESSGAATVAGTATFNGPVNVKAGSVVDLGYLAAGREGNAGKIGYGIFTPPSPGPIALDIVGAGTGWRTVKVHDDLTVSRDLLVSGTATFTGALAASGTGNVVKDLTIPPSGWADLSLRISGPTSFSNAFVVNDNNAYKALMIVGNDYATAGTRLVKIFDSAWVSKDLEVVSECKCGSLVVPLALGSPPSSRTTITPVTATWYKLNYYISLSPTAPTRYHFNVRIMMFTRGSAPFQSWIMEFTPSNTQSPAFVSRYANSPRPYDHNAASTWRTVTYDWYMTMPAGANQIVAAWIFPDAGVSGTHAWDFAVDERRYSEWTAVPA